MSLNRRDVVALAASAPLAASSGALWAPSGGLRAAAPAHGEGRLLDYLGQGQREAAVAGSDTNTDHSQYLQAALDDGWHSVDLGYGKFNLRKPIKIRNNTQLIGRRAGTVFRTDIAGYIAEAQSTDLRLAVDGVEFVSASSDARAGGFKLFDPATFHFRNAIFRNYNAEAVRFVQGVQIAIEDCVFVNCGMTNGGAAVHFDPGATSTVLPSLHRAYFYGCGTALRAEVARALRVNSSIFEKNAVATQFDRVDGLIDDCWFEANGIDGRWTDCSGLDRLKVFSTATPSGRWQIGWRDNNLADRQTVTNQWATAFATNMAERAIAAPRRWDAVEFDSAGPGYRASVQAGGDPRRIEVFETGLYRVSFWVQLSNRDTGGANVGARLRVGTTTAAGSAVSAQVAAGDSQVLRNEVTCRLQPGQSLTLEWYTSSSRTVIAASPIAGQPVVNASIRLDSLGIVS